MKKLFGQVSFAPMWWEKEYGIISKNPVLETMEEQLEQSARKERLLFERFGHLGLGSPNPDPDYQIPIYDGRVLTAAAYGGKEPGWDSASACFWWDKSSSVWGELTSPKDLLKIKAPDWENNPLAVRCVEQFQAVKASEVYRRGKAHSPWATLRFCHPVTGETFEMVNYMSGVDLAPFLYGDTDFFAVLLEDEEVARAILEKCYEIAGSYADFLAREFEIDLGACGWASIGGDYSCVMSPTLYEAFCKPFDLRRMQEKEDCVQAINLHSCGASTHLYDVWARYPHRERIKVMQTRGIPGALAHLRACLPETWIQWTLHQPQCDFEHISEEMVDRVVRDYAKQAGYENLEITAIVAAPGEQTDRNIEAFYGTIAKINEELVRDGTAD